MKISILAACAVVGFTAAVQANTITWTFQEDGTDNLGSPTRTFTESGVSLTAISSGPNLFAKAAGGDETGLGLNGTLDNEISGQQWIALQLPTLPPSQLQMVLIGSVQSGESAKVYWGAAPGSTTTLLGTLSGNGSVNISGQPAGFITVTSPSGNILIDSVSANITVPDGASTLTLLGLALTGLGVARRKFVV